MSTTLITSRDPKGLHAVGLFEAAYNKAKLDDERAQRLNEHGGELQAGIAELIARLSLPCQYSDEEVESNYGYLSGYTKPNEIGHQLARLRELFPSLTGNANVRFAENDPPDSAEGWFAIPRWNRLAPTYPEAVKLVLAKINEVRGGQFYNYRDGQIDAAHLRQSVRTITMVEQLEQSQGDYDFNIVAGQLGLHHRGRSVRWARETFVGSEFGLGAFEIGVILLTHPNRLENYDDLWIDCPGDEFSGDGGSFGRAPYFGFGVDGVEFGSDWVGDASGRYGSASGFIPQ